LRNGNAFVEGVLIASILWPGQKSYVKIGLSGPLFNQLSGIVPGSVVKHDPLEITKGLRRQTFIDTMKRGCTIVGAGEDRERIICAHSLMDIMMKFK